MTVKRRTQRVTDKWKTKKWFTLFASKEFNNKELGETIAQKEENVMNRVINTTLGNLTNDRKLRHLIIKFRVIKVEGTKAFTELDGIEANRSYVGRVVRKRKSKVELVTRVNTKDNKKVKIISLTMTARKAPVSKEKEIRKIVNEVIKEEASKKNYAEFMQDVAFGRLGKKTFDAVRAVYPVRQNELVKAEHILK